MAVKTYAKGDTSKLSKNFSAREFRCGLGHGCGCTTTLIDDKLVEYLQMIRDHFGKGVIITSGYRCPSYNRSVGGTTGSYHSRGQAADIVVQCVSPRKVAQYAESIGIKGIGLYETEKDGNFTHIDTRTYKSFWYGQAQEARSTFGAYQESTKNPSMETTTSASGYTLEQFVTDVQKANGSDVDGIAGMETLSKTKTLSKSYNSRNAMVMPVQKRLIALGYNPGIADGVYGQNTAYAVAKYQSDHGCVSDGIITAKGKTWMKLLGVLQ